MTRDQAAAAMTQLALAFSHSKLPDDELEVWYGSSLERCPLDIGREVVRRIQADDRFWPTPARFNEVRRAVERGLQPDTPALTAGPLTSEERAQVKRMIVEAHEVLRRQAGAQHFHGGPEPCRVCGGVKG